MDLCDKAFGHLNFSIRVFPEDICHGRIDWYLLWVLKRNHSTYVLTLSKLVREFTFFYFRLNQVLRDILIAASDLTICLVSWQWILSFFAKDRLHRFVLTKLLRSSSTRQPTLLSFGELYISLLRQLSVDHIKLGHLISLTCLLLSEILRRACAISYPLTRQFSFSLLGDSLLLHAA